MPVSCLTRIDFADEMLFDLQGNNKPKAVFMDYIQAGLHDGNYDLQKVLEIFNAHPRVRMRNSTLSRDWHDQGTILNIPYYNREDYKTQYIEAMFEPSEQEAIAMWEWQLAQGSRYPSTLVHEAIRALDVLGLIREGAYRAGSDS